MARGRPSMDFDITEVEKLGMLGATAPEMAVIGTGVFFIAPLKTLPADVKDMQHDVKGMQQTQAVQTEALKTLADVASDTKTMRRDVDKHEAALDAVKERLNRLEAR